MSEEDMKRQDKREIYAVVVLHALVSREGAAASAREAVSKADELIAALECPEDRR